MISFGFFSSSVRCSLQADYSKLVGEQEKHEEAKKKPMPPSRLAECVQRLLKMICDIRAMEEVVMELEYDATKAPLGSFRPIL